MRRALVLDLDGSVCGLHDADICRLQEQQEAIRFSCSLRQLADLVRMAEQPLEANTGVVFVGSGDFHHVSFALIDRVARRQPIEVVVLDNHPDNMRWMGGIHCGSWVRHVTRLPNVSHVHVLGITSPDISARQLWANYLSPLLRGRLTYWSVGVTVSWMHRWGWRSAFNNFRTAAELCEAFAGMQAHSVQPVYLSIDKDVLAPDLVTCNWDQGCFEEQDVQRILTSVKGRIVASDITGELSAYDYKAGWKRWISSRDEQPVVDLDTLSAEQGRHGELNARLARRIHEAMAVRPASS